MWRKTAPHQGCFRYALKAALAAALVLSITLSPCATAARSRSDVNTGNVISDGVAGKNSLMFSAGYNSVDWSGYLVATSLNADGSSGDIAWDAGKTLNATSPDSRIIFSARFNPDGSFATGLEFRDFALLDEAAKVLLMHSPAVNATRDTGQARVDWLRGSHANEATGTLRQRATILGSVVHASPLYVAYPSEGYRNGWPDDSPGQVAPESAAVLHPVAGTGYVSYEQFARDKRGRRPVVYVGSNDGMLHAIDAARGDHGSSVPGAGKELWAYVPRSAYGRLGELTRRAAPRFIPVVDATPVSGDVFFPRANTRPAMTTAGWHTIIVGGLGGGGRGVYALDITQPGPEPGKTTVDVADAVGKVLWEFDAGMPAIGASHDAGGTNPGGSPADLGYTYGQPNIGRLANGRWVVLIPSGVLPECGKAPEATHCDRNDVHGYSALFVVDAQTGTLIAEVKTPTNIAGVVSYALSSPVLGDYNDDQVDDVAFAGDGAGNLWRYDLRDRDPSQWTAKLAYRPETPGAQPISVMPRLLPDPATNRFIVVFGTGGMASLEEAPDADASVGHSLQAVYGIRDTGRTVMGTHDLVAQTLTETAASGSSCAATRRSLTNNIVPIDKDGWYFNLSTPGERVVVSAGALFDTNRLVITTSIDGSGACSETPQGAVMVVDGANGGAGDGISLGASVDNPAPLPTRTVGGRIDNPPLAGVPPVAGAIGGGMLVFPGLRITGGAPLTTGDAIWRRRSWRELFDVL